MQMSLLCQRSRKRRLGWIKLLLLMKSIAIFTLATALHVSASGFSQTITIASRQITLGKVFKLVEEQTHYAFLWNKRQLDESRVIRIDVKQAPLDQVMKLCLEGLPLTYRISNRVVIIEKARDPEPLRNRAPVEIVKDISVSGTVTDEAGNPLSGASISVKGSSTGTSTDNNGRFSIRVPSAGSILVVSYVGMAVQEVPVKGKEELRIIMVREITEQQEVVLIGYGTAKKQAVTGAVATANLKTYENVAVNNVLETVKGVVPGLNVGAINRAGAEAGISIRGQNSNRSNGSNPLIVVDGAIFRGSLSDIAPADIESFTVLKDASAAAVYGSRSANGVILVETRRGSSINGKPKFNVTSSYGFTNELEPVHVYDAKSYLQRVLDIRAANGLPADPDNIAAYLTPIEADNYRATPDHSPTLVDPYNLFRQTGQALNTTASVSNRTDKTAYYISGNIIKQKGVIVNDLYNHYSARVRVATDLTNWFNLGINTYYSLKDFPGATVYGASGGGSSSSTYQFSPYASLRGDDGNYLQFPQTTTSFNSPYWQIPDQKYDRQNNLNGILTAVIKVPWVKGLSYNLTTSITQNWDENGSFYGLRTVNGLPKNGTGDVVYTRNTAILIDQLVKYNHSFGVHNVDATLLYSTEDYKTFGQSSHGENFNDPSLGIYGLGKGQIQSVSTNGTRTAATGQMGRLTYTYAGKYSLTGTIRRDGFSAFSENHKYGVFSSAGINWQLSKERFMNTVSFVNNLALRASFGTNGNQSIDAYGTLSKMGNSKYYYNGASYVITEYVGNLGNNDLKWENTKGLNLGLDFSVLNSRLSGAIDWYDKSTENLIFPLQIPSTSGFTLINTNLGKIGNKGIEISLSSENIRSGNFSWRSDFAFSRNWNKLITAYGPDPKTGIEADRPTDGLFIGKSLGIIYGYQVTGMWQVADSVNGTIMKGMRPGTYKLLDVNGDGKITSDADRVFLGDSKVRYTWSLTNTFRYKNLSLMMYLYSLWGGRGAFLSGSNTPYNDGYSGTSSINHMVYDYWTPTNPDALFPGLNYATAASYKGVKYFDRSFIKLQKIALTYDCSGLVKRYGIHGMSFSVSADNLFTYAPHWEGLDPETNVGFTDGAIPSLRTVMGVLTFNF